VPAFDRRADEIALLIDVRVGAMGEIPQAGVQVVVPASPPERAARRIARVESPKTEVVALVDGAHRDRPVVVLNPVFHAIEIHGRKARQAFSRKEVGDPQRDRGRDRTGDAMPAARFERAHDGLFGTDPQQVPRVAWFSETPDASRLNRAEEFLDGHFAF